MKSYKDLEIYQRSFALATEVHRMTISLPGHEKYEIGSQIRRASQSVTYNIVEGYGRRAYKNEFIRFLIFSHASLLEVSSQLEMLQNLYEIKECEDLLINYDQLGKKIYSFINYVSQRWDTSRKP